MSTEWWNLDQALMWAATRDMGLVEEAGGHPSNHWERDGSWLLYWLSTRELESVYGSISETLVKNNKSRVINIDSDKAEAGKWERILIKALSRGEAAAIECTDSFPAIHPAWFLGAYVDCFTNSIDKSDRVEIARVRKINDGEPPHIGISETKSILINGDELRKSFPASGGTLSSLPSSERLAPGRSGGRVPKYDVVLFIIIAAHLIYEKGHFKSQSELRKLALSAYQLHSSEKDIPSDEWAKIPVRRLCHWFKLGI